MSAALLEIDRMPLRIRAAGPPDRGERLARRLRDAVETRLAAALAEACGGALEQPDYIFIDQLEVGCTVAAHWPAERIATALAARIAAALAEAETGPAPPLVFSDRAALLAAVLGARAREGAPGAPERWWCAEFAGLASLPLPGLVETVLRGEGAEGAMALGRLAAPVRDQVLAALDRSAAARVADTFAALPGPAAPARTVLTAAEAVLEARAASPAHRRLAAFARIAAEDAAATGASLQALDAVLTLCAAVERILHVGPDEPDTAPETAWPGDRLSRWVKEAGLPPRLAEALRSWEETDLDRLETLLARAAAAMPAAAHAPEAEAQVTPFGGALILMQLLVDLGWWGGWLTALRQSAPPGRAAVEAAWLALATAAWALDPARRREITTDPVLLTLFGAARGPGPLPGSAETRKRLLRCLSEDGLAWPPRRRTLARLLKPCGRLLLTELGRRLPGCDGASPAYLRRNCLALEAEIRGERLWLSCPPLDILLSLAGLKRRRLLLPDGRALQIADEAQP